MTEDNGQPLQQPIDPVLALSEVVDDESTFAEARRWAAAELLAGQEPEVIVAHLVQEDWDADEAEHIVEIARKNTRDERGVLTRDTVLRDLNVDYRRATGGLSVAFRSGLFGLYGFTTGFMAAMRSFRRLKSIQQSPTDATSAPPPRD